MYRVRGSGMVDRHTRRFTSAELKEFRRALIEKRQEILGDLDCLRKEALGGSALAERRGSSGLTHKAELASATWEQEFTIGLLESERSLLSEINDALRRMRQGTYGICEATRKPISKARLRAIPWARYCIEYARTNTNDQPRNGRMG